MDDEPSDRGNGWKREERYVLRTLANIDRRLSALEKAEARRNMSLGELRGRFIMLNLIASLIIGSAASAVTSYFTRAAVVDPTQDTRAILQHILENQEHLKEVRK